MTTLLTRADFDGYDEDMVKQVFDSIRWLYEVHLRRIDDNKFNSAILHGNEDCPYLIEFFRDAKPLYDQTPDYIWRNPVFKSNS